MGRALMDYAVAGRRLPGWLRAGTAGLLACGLWGCLSLAGRGSEVENPEVYGVMVDESGAAVVGARVLAYPAAVDAASPAVPADSAVTGAGGRYALSELPAGEYNVVGDFREGSLVVLIPEVRVAADSGLSLGKDTLRDPGGIAGRVVQGGAGKAGVMAYIPGTSFLALTDAEGAFLLPKVPKGVYRLNYQAAGLQADPDTGVVVEPGLITRLPDKVLAYDTAAPPPAPNRVEAAFDTLRGIATLRWNPVRLGDLFGYRVYRDVGALSLPVAVSGILTDTVFTDTVRKSVAAGQPPPVFGYRIRTVDRQRNEGTEYSPAIQVAFAPPSLVTTTVSLRLEFAQIFGKVGVGHPARLRTEWSNPTRRIRRVEWFLDSALVRTVETDAAQGTDSLIPVFPEAGIHRVQVRAADDAGMASTAAMDIEVILDPPTAWAGPDLEVAVGDSVRLEPQAFDLLGWVVRMEWALGADGAFQEAPLGSLAFKASDTPVDAYRCILRVTDNDGNTSLDTLFVRVVPGIPEAWARARPQEAFLEDTVFLSSDGSRDGSGRIVAWEWDIGKRGLFVPSPDGTFRIHGTVPADGVLPCVLRVTDDVGWTDTAEVAVTFRNRDQWALWLKDQEFQDYHLFDAWVSEERLHVLGRRPGGVPVLMRTSDAHSWESSQPKGLPSALWEVRTLVHSDRIWIADRNSHVLWHSRTGAEWDSVAVPEFRELQDMTLMSHAGALWLAGRRGWHEEARGEIWSSRNGAEWTLVSDSAAFGASPIFTGISWKGRIWAMVQRAIGSESDLWSSADGLAWRLEADGGLWDQRWETVLAVHQDRLWVVNSNEGNHTGDGANWTQVPLEAPDLPAHHDMRPVSFRGRLWMVTGSSAGGEQQWRIWRAAF